MTLKPCPFCGSQDIAIMREGKVKANAEYRAVCRECKTRGPKFWVQPWHYGNKFVAQGQAGGGLEQAAREVSMTVDKTIRSLEDQARDKDRLASGDPESIFTRDADVLMEVANLLKKLSDPPPNVPLTLDELRQMDGEPVWVVGADDECINRNGYAVVHFCYEEFVQVLWPGDANESEPLVENYGKTWLAYRRKPEGGIR